jgi:hypothetical protein
MSIEELKGKMESLALGDISNPKIEITINEKSATLSGLEAQRFALGFLVGLRFEEGNISIDWSVT